MLCKIESKEKILLSKEDRSIFFSIQKFIKSGTKWHTDPSNT